MSAEPGWRSETGGLRQNPRVPKGRYSHVFRLRTTPEQMDAIKKLSVESRDWRGRNRSQQEIVREAISWYIEEMDRVQGVTATLTGQIMKEEVVRAANPKRKRERVTTPEADPSKRDGRSVEDKALRRLQKHIAANSREM